MTVFFQNKIFIFDVDNTLLDWSNHTVFFHNLALSKQIIHFQKKLEHIRGQRRNFSYESIDSSAPPIADNIHSFITEIQNQGHLIAVLSDLPHPELHPFFAQYHINVIVNGQDIKANKPLPDGLWQIQSTFSGRADQMILIGDQEYTDHRAAFNHGSRFIHVKDIKAHRWKEILAQLKED